VNEKSPTIGAWGRFGEYDWKLTGRLCGLTVTFKGFMRSIGGGIPILTG